MALKAGINGFGRIGRNVFRAAHGAAPTSTGSASTTSPTPNARPPAQVRLDPRPVPGHGRAHRREPDRRRRRAERVRRADPAALPWSDAGAEVVIESTGFFTKRDNAAKHLEAGAKKVIISAPATEPDVTLVLGVNDDAYDTDEAPRHLERVVHDELPRAGREGPARRDRDRARDHDHDPRLHGGPEPPGRPHKDLRRARAAAVNLVPTSTGAAKAIGLVLPELDGKLNGIAVRAPVITGSMVDLVCEVSRARGGGGQRGVRGRPTGPLEGILEYNEDPIVSSDIVGRRTRRSSTRR